jgi:hypothetical protein
MQLGQLAISTVTGNDGKEGLWEMSFTGMRELSGEKRG